MWRPQAQRIPSVSSHQLSSQLSGKSRGSLQRKHQASRRRAVWHQRGSLRVKGVSGVSGVRYEQKKYLKILEKCSRPTLLKSSHTILSDSTSLDHQQYPHFLSVESLSPGSLHWQALLVARLGKSSDLAQCTSSTPLTPPCFAAGTSKGGPPKCAFFLFCVHALVAS